MCPPCWTTKGTYLGGKHGVLQHLARMQTATAVAIAMAIGTATATAQQKVLIPWLRLNGSTCPDSAFRLRAL
eukprot:4854500-Prorocentrum_lima.AAC.1